MIRVHHIAALLLAGIVFTLLVMAQTPTVSFTAATDNVAGAPDNIKIDVLRWSTDAERDLLLGAWNLTAPAGGKGKGGKGKAAPDPAPDPSAVDTDLAPVGDGNPAAGRGGKAGKAGKGGGAKGGKGGAALQTPEGSLAAALGKAPAVGRLWSSEVSGYSLRYAVKLAEADGGERIILITDRRLGAWNDLWKPAAPGTGANYEFSVIELHLNSKGEGEGKTSLTGKAVLDSAAKTLALENYGALPVILKNVRRK
jgi:hypothetical protein